MMKLLGNLITLVGKPHLIEFDYKDTSGWHHGRCYTPLFFTSKRVVKRELKRYGYINIHVF
jgi:hypothetical protein